MSFVEFSNSLFMQVILLFMSVLSAGIHNWVALDIIQTFYDEEIALKKKIIYIIVVSVIMYNGVIYGVYALNILNSYIGIHEWQRLLVMIPSPLLAVAGYLIITVQSRFKGGRIINIIRQVYVYCIITCTIAVTISQVIMAKCSDQHNYFAQFISTLLFTLFSLGMYRVVKAMVKRYSFIIHTAESITVNNTSAYIYSIISVVLVYAATLYLLNAFKRSFVGHIAVIAVLVALLICDVIITYKVTLKTELDNKTWYITSLVQSVNKYFKLKQDFNVILENYGKYINKGDMAEIAGYHQELMGKTILTVQSIDISQKMPQNPALVSLLIKQSEFANQMGVSLFIPAMCSLEDMYVDNTDLVHILSNLFTNAIEAACVSDERKVSFLVTQKSPYCKLIVISNSTAGDIEMHGITSYGITTKTNHMGAGLNRVRSIIRKYPNSSLSFFYEHNEFSVYIELLSPEI